MFRGLLIACLVVPAFAADQPLKPQGKPSTLLPDGVERFENITYARYGRRSLWLDVFKPEAPGTYPGVLVVHGGGWQNGDKTKFRPLCQQLAQRGYVTACVQYRLSNEARFPAALHDLKAAVRWMRANAKRFGIDQANIGAIGGSAGGHLVGVLATSPHVDRLEGDGGNPKQSSALQAAVIFGGGVDLVSRFEKNPDDPSPNALVFFGGPYLEQKELYAEASATTHLEKHTPPTLFMDCSFDQPGERYVTMRAQMDELGIRNEFALMEGGKHGCWNSHPWFEPMLDRVDAFLGDVLRP